MDKNRNLGRESQQQQDLNRKMKEGGRQQQQDNQQDIPESDNESTGVPGTGQRQDSN